MHRAGTGDFSRPMSEDEAEDLLRCICFKTGPPRTLGVEVEWLVHDREQPGKPVPPDGLRSAFDDIHALPLTSVLTFDPGGQLELSSRPAASPSASRSPRASGSSPVLTGMITETKGFIMTAGNQAL